MHRMACRRSLVVVISLLLAAALLPAPVPAAEEDLDKDQESLAKALRKGKVSVTFRYRWEQVEDDYLPALDPSFYRDGYASTLRTTLGYRTARWVGLSAYLEFQDVSNLGAGDKHNSTTNGVIDRPVVADPRQTIMQQGYIRYTRDGVVEATVGRLGFVLNDRRYLAQVSWRQNYQTFDLARVDLLMIPRTRIVYVHADRVHRVVADSLKMSTNLLNATVDLGQGKLWGYGYFIHYDQDTGLLAQSSNTVGVAWEESRKVSEEWSIPDHVQVARQKDGGDNPEHIDADYLRLEVGGKREACWFKGGYELLGGSPQDGQFNTPLALLHAYNGLADRFVVTPPGGLEDIFIATGGKWGGSWAAQVQYHLFGTDSAFVDAGGNTVSDYGTELDATVTYTASWQQTFSLGFALYRAADASVLPTGEDVDKFWFWSTYKF